MATIELTPDKLGIHLTGSDKFLALKSQLEIPLEHVVSAEIDPQTRQEWQSWYLGLRVPGTHVPGVIAAGTFYKHGERVFWDVQHPEQTITINLAHDKYSKLVVEVDDPAATVAVIQQAITQRSRS